MKNALDKITDFHNLIFELSIKFINLPLKQVNSSIHYSLGLLAEFFNADRAYIFNYDFNLDLTSNTYEWCAPGILPQIDELQSQPMENFPEWLSAHLAKKPFIIDDLETFPASPLKDVLQPQGIKSLIAYPIYDQEQCIGFVGLDSVKNITHYGELEIKLLALFSELIVGLKKRQQTEDSLLQAMIVFEQAYEGILITDEQGYIQNVNASFVEMSGIAKENLLEKPFYALDWSVDSEMEKAVVWNALKNMGYWTGELKKQRHDQSEFIVRVNISNVKNTDGAIEHFVMVFAEQGEINRHSERARLSSHYDSLTQLPNRLILTEQLGKAMLETSQKSQLLGLVFFDVDNFKQINDTYSHEKGNQLLIELAKRLRAHLRMTDFIARIGGDEFAIIIDKADSQTQINLTVDKLLNLVNEPFCLNQDTFHITASMGVTYFPQDDDLDPDQLIRQADQAMFQSKQAGKNRIKHFDMNLDKSIRGRYQNIARIRSGFTNQEFELYYQPKVNMRTGMVESLEALIRWNQPNQGVLRPYQFLPEIEGHYLSVELGEWVIETALQQIEELERLGFTLGISVNIDGLQLQQADFVAKLKRALLRHPTVKPALLEIEILESAALDDIDDVSRVIRNCRDLGIRVSLDDFGTGYSSLTYLKQLKANALKIDQSFVRDMLTDPEDLAILEGVIGLANAFQLQVIAEGVESADHMDILMRLGCNIAQGYAISRPLMAHNLVDWITQWQTQHRPKQISVIRADKLPILYALVEHHAWVKRLKQYLQDVTLDRPPLDIHQCQFGHWLDQNKTYFKQSDLIQKIDDIHHDVHNLANEFVMLKQTNQLHYVLMRFHEMEALRDTLTIELNKLMDI